MFQDIELASDVVMEIRDVDSQLLNYFVDISNVLHIILKLLFGRWRNVKTNIYYFIH